MKKTTTDVCDVCGDKVPVPEEFNEHNAQNYVRHVFLSHPDDAARIRIIQYYIDKFLKKV